VRVGLLVELERRALVKGDKPWVRLLRDTTGTDRLSVLRAARGRRGRALQEALVEILRGSDSRAASAAAIALGSPGNTEAVAVLSKAVESTEQRVAMAAIRALGGIGTVQAREALSTAATSHANPTIRRRAQAELRILASRGR
jgi:HEAT repeat protein